VVEEPWIDHHDHLVHGPPYQMWHHRHGTMFWWWQKK
jgi:hypothetical protein